MSSARTRWPRRPRLPPRRGKACDRVAVMVSPGWRRRGALDTARRCCLLAFRGGYHGRSQGQGPVQFTGVPMIVLAERVPAAV
jgi:hypothetical protein